MAYCIPSIPSIPSIPVYLDMCHCIVICPIVFFFSEFMIQTRVKLFRRILDTVIQCDVLFIFPREVRYCKALSVSTCGAGHHRNYPASREVPSIFLCRNEGSSKPFVSLLYCRTIPRAGDHGSEAKSE